MLADLKVEGDSRGSLFRVPVRHAGYCVFLPEFPQAGDEGCVGPDDLTEGVSVQHGNTHEFVSKDIEPGEGSEEPIS